MNELRQQNFSLVRLLKVAGLARSTFYWHLGNAERKEKYSREKAFILETYHHHRGRYGYRRITIACRKMGWMLNHKTVRRLMLEQNLKSRIRVKKYRSYRGQYGRSAPNLLERKFSADRPNQKWVTDVTEFRIKEKKLYLSPIVDLYNGEVIAWSMAESPGGGMVNEMLMKAVATLKDGETPLVHTDQGWQYHMHGWKQVLKERSMPQSMSGKGNCLDNARMENFFGTLKAECWHGEKYKDVAELMEAVDEYIHYYNTERISLKLKGLSPVEYRTQALMTA